MEKHSTMQSNRSTGNGKFHFHGAAIIDAQGREIPITEAMVQQACHALERHWHFPSRQAVATQA